jgi:hypothetical protein
LHHADRRLIFRLEIVLYQVGNFQIVTCGSLAKAFRNAVSGVTNVTARRFPPPWSIEEFNDACFVVKGQRAMVANHFL